MSEPVPTGTTLTERYSRAVEYARVVHEGDVRKGTDITYLSHLLSVSALVLEGRGDEDQAIAALLHDTAEDHGGEARIADIRAEFGRDVAAIVEACSDSLTEDPEPKPPWWTRKVRYLRQLEHEDPRAALVSCADKLHNARAILADYRVEHEQLWSRFNADAGRRGELWYYRRLAEILPPKLIVDGNPNPLGLELVRTVSDLRDAVAASPDAPDAAALEEEWQSALRTEQDLLPA